MKHVWTTYIVCQTESTINKFVINFIVGVFSSGFRTIDTIKEKPLAC